MFAGQHQVSYDRVSAVFVLQLLVLGAKLKTLHYRTVRSSAALALGKLSALSSRVDPLVSDLLSTLQVIFTHYTFVYTLICLLILSHAAKLLDRHLMGVLEKRY